MASCVFHVFLVLPALLGAGALALFVLSLPFLLGGVLQLLLTVFSAGKRWVVWVPAALGGVGLVLSLIYGLEAAGPAALLVYWGLYFLMLWLIWLIVSQIKKAVLRWRSKE